MPSPSLRFAFLLLGLAAAPLPAQDARMPARDASPAPDRLRHCVALEIERQDFDARMVDAERALSAARAETRAYDDQVERRHRALDVTDADAVLAYNRLLDRHDALVKAQNDRLADYNALVEQHNASVDRFNADCLGTAYTRDQRNAERERQLKARGDRPR